MDIERFTECANRIVDEEVPEPLLRDLNLGIVVADEVKREGANTYVLGQYSVSRMGRSVVLFYGSFRALYADKPETSWERRIRNTIKHELRHHMESLAGDEQLAREERRERSRRAQGRPAKNRPETTPFSSMLRRIRRWLLRIGNPRE